MSSSSGMETHSPNWAARRTGASLAIWRGDRGGRGRRALGSALGAVCFYLERGLPVLS